MLKTFIKNHKDELTFYALYAGAAIGGAVIAYAAVSLKHAPDLELKKVYEEMLSNPYLDDVRKYGVTEIIETVVAPNTPMWFIPAN